MKEARSIYLSGDDSTLHGEQAESELQKDLPELHEWLMPFGRYGSDFFTYKKILDDDSPTSFRYRIRLYSQTSYYTIVVHPRDGEKELWYLGGFANARAPRAGEEHTRGNDIPDGKYTKETFDDIIQSILSLELVQIGSDQK